jgi:hypothetical protein
MRAVPLFATGVKTKRDVGGLRSAVRKLEWRGDLGAIVDSVQRVDRLLQRIDHKQYQVAKVSVRPAPLRSRLGTRL